MARRTIQIPEETWEELWHIKGPHRTFGQLIKDLINTVYPPENEDKNQTLLVRTCPECDEIFEDGICPGCGYPEEDD